MQQQGQGPTPYEFGVKVSIATTLKEGLVVGMLSKPGNPYDGHTLEQTLEQIAILAQRKPTIAIADKGYRGVEIEGVRIVRSGQKRCTTRTLKAMIHRGSAIEPAIGHMKMDERLGRNPLRVALEDVLHAVMCGAGHNLRLIWRSCGFLPPDPRSRCTYCCQRSRRRWHTFSSLALENGAVPSGLADDTFCQAATSSNSWGEAVRM